MRCPTCNCEIKNHPANACLDALFAEKVMGKMVCDEWLLHGIGCQGISYMLPPDGCKHGKFGKTCYPSQLPTPYSSNIAHAMEGVEKYRKEIFLEIRILPGIVYCGVYPNNPGSFPFVFSNGEQLELAIVRALVLWAMREGG